MSRRNVLKKYQLFNGENTSLNPVSKETDVSQLDFVTYQLTIDPTVNATLLVLFSNDERFDASNVQELDFGSPIVLDGATESQYLLHIENNGFKWLLINIVNNTGFGLASAWVTGNVRGA